MVIDDIKMDQTNIERERKNSLYEQREKGAHHTCHESNSNFTETVKFISNGRQHGEWQHTEIDLYAKIIT